MTSSTSGTDRTVPIPTSRPPRETFSQSKFLNRLVNLTPHDVTVLTPDGDELLLRSAGVIRSGTSVVKVATLHYQGQVFDITVQGSTGVGGMPPPQPGTYYIVSRQVAEALKGQRTDIFYPGPLVKDTNGKVVGCRGLSRAA